MYIRDHSMPSKNYPSESSTHCGRWMCQGCTRRKFITEEVGLDRRQGTKPKCKKGEGSPSKSQLERQGREEGQGWMRVCLG